VGGWGVFVGVFGVFFWLGRGGYLCIACFPGPERAPAAKTCPQKAGNDKTERVNRAEGGGHSFSAVQVGKEGQVRGLSAAMSERANAHKERA